VSHALQLIAGAGSEAQFELGLRESGVTIYYGEASANDRAS